MIQAVIFDMDGVIIDSEPLWRRGEIEIFKSVGVQLTDEMCRQTVGLRLDEAVKHWHNIFHWKNKTFKQLEDEIINKLIEFINEESVPVNGVNEVLEMLRNKNIRTALASSSAIKIIETVLNKFKLKDKFAVINSAEQMRYGKPHPEIYLDTANKLGINPQNCLAIEDSFNGLLSAKSSRMKAVVIPEEHNKNDKRFAIADVQLNSLVDFNETIFNQLNE